ncbi:MAG TPA: hypothetical protein VGS21_12080 [Acidimicrobiales bacterium]|nr:hypothetical protein [Acidimicrobiales bacterium]
MTPDPAFVLPQPASRHAVGLLRFPDRKTDWVVVAVATLGSAMTEGLLGERLAALHEAVPMVGARLRDETWHPGEPAEPIVAEDALLDRRTDEAFRLGSEPPLRLVLGDGGRQLALAGHHAAFDGLALVAILRSLLGGSPPPPVTSPPPGPPESKLPLVRRLLRPADRVAPSMRPPGRDSYSSAEATTGKSQPTGQGPATRVAARLAGAAAAAIAERNSGLGVRMNKVGVSLSVGGPPGIGNVASYRRVDVDVGRGESVEHVSDAALSTHVEPTEQVQAGLLLKLAAPVLSRFSDTFLVSNLGRLELPGAARLDFFPVARGRSAVAFGAATIADGRATVSLRARDLDPSDADALLTRTVELFA